jgi:hypothetical protein
VTWKIHDVHTTKKRINLYILGDLHIGADTTDVDAIAATVEKIRRDSFAHVILLGDLLELAMKPHMQRNQIIPPHLQIRRLKDLIRPIRNKIRFICEGNHEKRVTRATGLDYLADALLPFCPNAVFLGYEGFVQYWMGDDKSDHLIYLHHGKGKSQTEHYLLDLAVKIGFDVADVIAISHGHKRHVKEYWRWKRVGGNIVPRRVWGIRAGSYLGHAQYAKDALYAAGAISGYVMLRLTDEIGVTW